MQKVKSINYLKNLRGEIGLITGCFDVIHAGHVRLLRFAKSNCDFLIVGLESDETIRKSKGENRPIHNLKQRMAVVTEFSSVDFVFPIKLSIKFGDKDAHIPYEKIVKKINPLYLFTLKSDKYMVKKREIMESIGGKVITFNTLKDTSTTSIARKISSEV